MAHHIKLNSPSGGYNEILRALSRRHAIPGRTRSLTDITRFLGPHYDAAAVATVLASMESDGLVTNPSGDQWGMTGAGLQRVREHPDSRFVSA